MTNDVKVLKTRRIIMKQVNNCFTTTTFGFLIKNKTIMIRIGMGYERTQPQREINLTSNLIKCLSKQATTVYEDSQR